MDDLPERGAFKSDEARALLHLKRFAEAEQAALACRALAQQLYNDEADLNACGVLVGALSCSPLQAAGTEIPCLPFKLFSMTATE
jgi:hypothetical protein